MSIVGDNPEGGVRFDLERTTTAVPWIYEGSLTTPTESLRLRVTVDAAGAVWVEDAGRLTPELLTRTKLLVRSVVKHAVEGQAPPQRIRRWRAS